MGRAVDAFDIDQHIAIAMIASPDRRCLPVQIACQGHLLCRIHNRGAIQPAINQAIGTNYCKVYRNPECRAHILHDLGAIAAVQHIAASPANERIMAIPAEQHIHAIAAT